MLLADGLKRVLWRALDQFSDKLYIKHNPVHHQEGTNAAFGDDLMLMLAGEKSIFRSYSCV